MLDFGLVGGRAAGGSGALASTATGKAPAGSAAAADADAGALGGAFRDLVDALSDGKRSPAEPAHARTSAGSGTTAEAAGNPVDAAAQTGVVELTAALPVAVPPFRPEEGPHTSLDKQAGAGGKEKAEASADAADASARISEDAPVICPVPMAPKLPAPDQLVLADTTGAGLPASASNAGAAAAEAPGEPRGKHAGASPRINTEQTDAAAETPDAGITFKRPAVASGEQASADAGSDAHQSEQRPDNLVRAATLRQLDGATAFASTPPAPVVAGPVVVVPVVTTPTAQVPTLRAVASDSPRSSASPESTAPQIVQAIRLAWSRGVGEAHIRLDPEQFGDVSVSLRVERGQVVARLQADAPAVREWLQANQHTLKSGLAEHELKLGRLDVVSPDDLHDQSRRDAREQGSGAGEDRPFRRNRRPDTGSRFEIVA